MRYVILILALLIGLPSAAYATDPDPVCVEDCSSYSSDIACDVEEGYCIEPYAQCCHPVTR